MSLTTEQVVAWQEKTGQQITKDISSNLSGKDGIYLKPVIAQYTRRELKADENFKVNKTIPHNKGRTQWVM